MPIVRGKYLHDAYKVRLSKLDGVPLEERKCL